MLAEMLPPVTFVFAGRYGSLVQVRHAALLRMGVPKKAFCSSTDIKLDMTDAMWK